MNKDTVIKTPRKRSVYFWNALAGLINAAEAVIMSMIVTRTTGLTDAGILSIAFSTGNIMMTVGEFGTNSLLITDVSDKYSFQTYLHARKISVLLMIILSALFVSVNILTGQYAIYKAVVVMSICLIYAVEALESVYRSFYQRQGHLEIGSKMFCIRWASLLTVFAVCMFVINNMEIAIVIALLVSAAVMFCCIYRTYPYFRQYNREDQHSEKALLMSGFSLLASSFLTFFVLNCPKYLLDYFASEEIVAYYGFISMPVFSVSLCSSFFYQPKIVSIANWWKSHDFIKIKSEIRKQVFIVMLITLTGVLVAYTIGIPVLSYLYATDLSAYRIDLIFVVLTSGFYAVTLFFSTILVIVGKKNWILAAYAIGSIFSLIICYRLLEISLLRGAVIGMMLSMMIVACIVITVGLSVIKSAN